MIWRFSDGTTVELGGVIRGASPFADYLRSLVEDGWFAHHLPQPSEPEQFDPMDPAFLDLWAHQAVSASGWWKTISVSSPEGVPALPELTSAQRGANSPKGWVF